MTASINSSAVVGLMVQLGVTPSDDAAAGISFGEIAGVVRKTQDLLEIVEIREHFHPEVAVRQAALADDQAREVIVSGTAAALVLDEDGRIDTVIYWKSDVAPPDGQRERYRNQVREYLRAIGARRGLVVYVTAGRIEEVTVG